jgi:DNA invertase Pin-like site-specific DNA recombinase
LASVAEHEANAISERTRTALAQAKARGVKLGGDKGHMPVIARRGHVASLAVRRAKADIRAADLLPVIAEIRAGGAASYHSVADALNERGIPTARGGRWQPMQVFRIERRAA